MLLKLTTTTENENKLSFKEHERELKLIFALIALESTSLSIIKMTSNKLGLEGCH
jgi:hypothetical protein